MAEHISPKFDANGLITAVALDAANGQVLMLAHMNQEALDKTLATGQVHYYSRSRKELWRKGATSGHTQTLVDMHVDCDQDAVIMRVEQEGAACHLGKRSCFFRAVNADGTLEPVGD